MKSKIILIIVLVAFCAGLLELATFEIEKKSNIEKYNINKKIKIYKINKSQNLTSKVQSIKVLNKKKENLKESWEKEATQLSNVYLKVSKEWTHKVKELFLQEFYLSDSDFENYLEIRKNYEEEKIDSYGKFYDGLKEKYGDDYTVESDTFEETIDEKIKKKYLDKIKNKIGSDNYSRFLDVIDEFNSIQKENASDESPQVIIDF